MKSILTGTFSALVLGAAIVTSYCPDAGPAAEVICRSTVPAKVFYDLDTPITLAAPERARKRRRLLALFSEVTSARTTCGSPEARLQVLTTL